MSEAANSLCRDIASAALRRTDTISFRVTLSVLKYLTFLFLDMTLFLHADVGNNSKTERGDKVGTSKLTEILKATILLDNDLRS